MRFPLPLALVAFMIAAVAAARDAAMPSMTPIPGTGTLGASTSDTFTFVVAGDNRPASAKDAQPKTPKHVFDSAAALHAAFVLWTGDMIYGFDSADAARIAKQYQQFFKLARRAGAPVFAAPGNHEMDVRAKHGDTTVEYGNAAMQAFYRAAMQIPDSAPIYGTFTYANSRFILLNTEEIRDSGAARLASPPGSKVKLDPGYVSARQLAWLEQVLDSNTALHTFVLMHHPLKGRKPDMQLDSACAAQVLALLARRGNISYVLASHEHLYYNAQTTDTAPPPSRTDPDSAAGAYFLVSGGAGAPLSGKPKDGGFHNFLVFTVRGATVNARMVHLP